MLLKRVESLVPIFSPRFRLLSNAEIYDDLRGDTSEEVKFYESLIGEGSRVVELGCGVGLPAIVAALGGADVLATDWYEDALGFVSANAAEHGVAAARYWDWGDDDKEFKWNNYLGRYHTRHLDLMDVLAMYQPRANAPLDQMAKLCGFPGKLGMDGSKVMDAFQQGEIDAIRNYCETDVMNTWLVYLRFQKMRGTLSESAYAAEIELARSTVQTHPAPHWQEFLAAWG